jgi:PAS domain S-box-containing protein
LIFSFTISYILSTIIKNSFERYKKNITDEIEKSKNIEKAKEEIDIQKEEFERLFEHSPIAMAFAQNDGKITKRNSKFINTFGFTQEDVPDVEHWYLNAYPDETYRKNIINKWEKEIKRSINNNGMINPIEVNITDKNGEVHNIIINSIFLKNGILASFMDLTKQKQQERLIYEQSKLASMGEMIGNIAHQWRQPLSVISTGATGLKFQKEYNTLSDEHFNQVCDAINNNAQYLSKTIDDFRNFIQGDRKKAQFKLIDNIDSFLHLLEGTIKNNNIEIELSIDKNIIIEGYPNELIQCFVNIFNNSKDALKNIQANRYIFISAQLLNNKLIIVFKDNAGGIPTDILPRIFEPYFTTKHQSQGTGLGLHMTYNLIVEGMNGSIEASNVTYEYKDKKYKGAQFIINLPIK